MSKNMEVNPQRILRTGDLVCTNKNKKYKVHYLVEADGQLSFESLLGKTQEIIVEGIDGKTIHLKTQDLVF
jgi:hypothetical protein